MKKKRILITGAVSLLGKYLIKKLAGNYILTGTYHKNLPDYKLKKFGCEFKFLDITSSQQIFNTVNKTKPNIIIHLAAVSNIDTCENSPQIAHKINIEGTQTLITQCRQIKPYIIFLSSNAIFDGFDPPYSENSSPHPLNIYGKTKLAGEKILFQSRFPATVIRSTTMFGWPPENCRDNDVSYYLKQLKQPTRLFLVNDRFFNPVYALRVAHLISCCIKQNRTGIYHIGGADRISRYSFVKKIIKAFNLRRSSPLIPVKSNFFPKLAPRPIDATLDVTKINKEFKIQPKPLIDELILLQKEQ